MFFTYFYVDLQELQYYNIGRNWKEPKGAQNGEKSSGNRCSDN